MANMVPAGAGNKSKYILRQFPIIRFYAALALSLVYFVIQLVVAHFAHSLILQIDAYHMLYNILSLTACIVTAKVSKQGNSLKNTFGWRRIDVCSAVASICFLSALGFSVLVECVQTITHASHHESMHFAFLVGVVGVVGLVVNSIIYFLIGGYTLHQSGFLCSKDGRGEDSVISASMRRGPYDHVMKDREGPLEIFRDFFGCVLVVVVAVIVAHWTDDPNADYVDPCFTIITVLILGMMSYRYAMEAGEILLLTIPNHIDVASLQDKLKNNFPQVFDIHEFHVWQLTPSKIIASVHVVLEKPQGYLAIQNNIIHFLHENGISHVTMQPEFMQMSDDVDSPQTIRQRKCFIPCRSSNDDEDCDCNDLQCCRDEEHDHDHDDDFEDHGHSHSHGGHGHSHQHRTNSSQFGSTSFNNSSFSNVQSLSSAGGALMSGGGLSSRLKSESLNNHLDISLDSMSFSNKPDTVSNCDEGGANTSVNISSNGSHNLREVIDGEESDSDDEEQVHAELRPMI